MHVLLTCNMCCSLHVRPGAVRWEAPVVEAAVDLGAWLEAWLGLLRVALQRLSCWARKSLLAASIRACFVLALALWCAKLLHTLLCCADSVLCYAVLCLAGCC